MKKAKRIISVLLSLLLAFSALSAGGGSVLFITAFGADFSGTCGENATWDLSPDSGRLTISGEGETEDYTLNITAPWAVFRSLIKSVSVGEGITTLGNFAFYNLTALTSASLPSSLLKIGNYAFAGCSTLSGITIPVNVVSIGEKAFQNCTALTLVNFNAAQSNNLTANSDVFYNAGKSAGGITVNFGSTVTRIPANICYVSGSSYRPKITHINISNGVTTIGEGAFRACNNLTSISIPDSVKTIGSSVFYYCSQLGSVNLGNGVESIGSNAFYDCVSLSEITLPKSIKTIGGMAFIECTGLSRVNYKGSVKEWCGITFGSNYANPVSYANNLYINGALLTQITADDLNTITKIGAYQFYNCKCLESITIPAAVKTFGNMAFAGCTGLTEVNYLGTVAGWCGITFANNSSNPVYTAKTLSIKGNPLTAVTASDLTGVTDTGDYQFMNCLCIETVDIPDCVKKMSFYGCSSITRVNYAGTVAGWCGIQFGSAQDNPVSCSHNLYINDELLTEITLEDTQDLEKVGDFAFYYDSALTSVNLSESVTQIGESAFQHCHYLSSVTLPDTVTDMGSYAFGYCYSIRSINIPSSLREIKEGTFSMCASLTEPDIPHGVRVIDANAFSLCFNMRIVHIPESVVEIGRDAFDITLTDSRVTRMQNLYNQAIAEGLDEIEDMPVDMLGRWLRNTGFKLTDVYYAGTFTRWDEMTIFGGNGDLEKANIHFLGYHTHDYYETVTVAPTCTQPGVAMYVCYCGQGTYTQEIPALGHDYHGVVTDPTCMRPGYTTYFCSRCTSVYTDDETPALGHDFSAGEVTEPTCTQGGYTTYNCSRCSEFYTGAETEPLGHRYATITVSASCEKGGYVEHKCIRCPYYYRTDQTAPLGHDYDEGVVTAPTCTEDGYTTHTCSRCHGTMTDSEVPASGHNYTSAVSAPTCTEGGYTKHTCTKCTHSYIDSEKPALGHIYTHYEYNNDATTESDGTETAKCDRCGEPNTRKKPGTRINPTKDASIKVKSGETVEYRANVTVTATAQNVPDGYVLAVYDGQKVTKGNNKSVSYNVGEMTGSNTLYVKVIDKNGNVQKDGNGKDLSEAVKIEVKDGFFDKLIAFFKGLFGLLPEIII